MTLDNLGYQYTYDAYGRPITAAGVQTSFDAFGRAVEQDRSGSYTQVVYAPNGQKFAFMNGTTLIKYIDPMVAGMAAVQNGPNGNPPNSGYFQHADWLGSSRWGHDDGGNVIYDRAYAPFGEPYAELNGTTTNRDFTGQTEDTTPGLYDFLFRQQSQSQGRWLVPDPAGLAAVDITNPQTWNRYAYVANNPLSNTDPLGLDCVRMNGDGSMQVFTDAQDACSGDNGYYFDGTVSNPYADANGNVVASVNGQFQCAGDSGCSIYNNSTSVTVNGGSGTLVDTITSTLTNVGVAVQNAGTAALNWLLTPRNPGCMAGSMAAGAGTGALAGGGIGSLGFAGGPAGFATTPAGAGTGSLIGGGVGWVGGMVSCAKGVGPNFGYNQAPNKVANDAKNQAQKITGKKMSFAQDELFHDYDKTGMSYKDMVQLAVDILNGRVY